MKARMEGRIGKGKPRLSLTPFLPSGRARDVERASDLTLAAGCRGARILDESARDALGEVHAVCAGDLACHVHSVYTHMWC